MSGWSPRDYPWTPDSQCAEHEAEQRSCSESVRITVGSRCSFRETTPSRSAADVTSSKRDPVVGAKVHRSGNVCPPSLFSRKGTDGSAKDGCPGSPRDRGKPRTVPGGTDARGGDP